MSKTFLGTAVLLLLMMTASCSDESAEMSSENQTEVSQPEADAPQIQFFTVETDSVAHRVSLSGRLLADNRVELFPEVQGSIKEGGKPFEEGIFYQNGEVLVQLDDSEARLQLQSTRSRFKTLVSALMADIKLDYPETLPRYEEWFDGLSSDESVTAIPKFGNGVQRFLESKGVVELYYSIKSAEEQLEKFTIRAPFSGVLSAVKAEPGQIVGPQFHLGTLVEPSRFKLTASVDPADAEWLRPGMSVEVTNQDQTRNYSAEITRVNPSVDRASQQVPVYLQVSGENLREGMYMEGEIESDSKSMLARIPKSALLRTGSVLVEREESLTELPVEIRNLERNHLWVTGLQNGDQIVADVSEAAGGRIINQD